LSTHIILDDAPRPERKQPYRATQFTRADNETGVAPHSNGDRDSSLVRLNRHLTMPLFLEA